MDKWSYYAIERKANTNFYINGILVPNTRFEWLNKIVFKIKYWWQFTRKMKDMTGKTYTPTFDEMAKELHERLRNLFPGGVYVKEDVLENGIKITIANYNPYDVYFYQLSDEPFTVSWLQKD